MGEAGPLVLATSGKGLSIVVLENFRCVRPTQSPGSLTACSESAAVGGGDSKVTKSVQE